MTLTSNFCSFGRVEEMILQEWNEGDILIHFLTGQAGGGKTTTVGTIVPLLRAMGVPAQSLGLDAYFRLSSRERKLWLKEGEVISPEEGARRRDQINWWDYDRLMSDLGKIVEGNPVQLRKIYNRAEGGELTGSLDIFPEHNGLVLLIEGVGLAHIKGSFTRSYIHAPAAVRYIRIKERDSNRRMSEEEAWARFRLTQEFESGYFQKHWGRMNNFFDNSNGHGPIRVDFLRPEEALADMTRPPLMSIS